MSRSGVAGRAAAVLGTAVVSAMVGACSEPIEMEEVVRPVRVVRVEPPQSLAGRSLPGRAQATEETNLSFDVPGTVLERPVNVGDEVEAGQLLARLDQRDFVNQRDAAMAARNRMQANFERVRIAAESGAVSRQDLDDARAQLDVTQAELNIAEKRIEDSVITAPRAGTISATYVEAFQSVRAKEPIVRLLDTSAIEMIVQVPEGLISFAPHVVNLTIEFDAFPGRRVPAQIKEISNEASLTTRTFPVTLIMDQPEDFKILPGMAGRTRGEVPEEIAPELSVMRVPLSAVFTPDEQEKSGNSFVWVIDESANTVIRRGVRTGELDRATIQIRDGLEAGELIVVSGVSFLEEGRTVRPVEQGRPVRPVEQGS